MYSFFQENINANPTFAVNEILITPMMSHFPASVNSIMYHAHVFPTSFPGSLLFTPQEAREGRPWLGLVTCLPKSGRLQISDWREGRLSVSLPILSVPGMGKHAPVRINLQNRACFKGHVKWSSRNP